jgi:hypothetical protein
VNSERTWSMKVNDDGSVTTKYGGSVKTMPAPFDQSGHLRLRLSVDAHQPGHDFHTADNGTKIKLSCSCDEFTAIIEGGTEDTRASAARLAHDEHVARVENGTNL